MEFAAQSRTRQYAKWPVETAGRSLRISRQAHEELTRILQDGTQFMPKRRLEVGGLIVGEASDSGFRIDSIHPIVSKYPEGPAFRVSEDDILQAERDIRRSGPAIGYYRTRTDTALSPDDFDELVFRTLGSDRPLAVLRILQLPRAPEEIDFGVYDGPDGYLPGEVLPFRRWQEGATWAAESIRVPIPEAPPQIYASVMAAPEQDPASDFRRKLIIGVMVFLAVLAAVYLLKSPGRKHPVEPISDVIHVPDPSKTPPDPGPVATGEPRESAPEAGRSRRGSSRGHGKRSGRESNRR